MLSRSICTLDFAVGCSNSSKVYVYRSRKVIKLETTINTLEKISNQTAFNVTLNINSNFIENNIKNVAVKLNYFNNENRIKSPIGNEKILHIIDGSGSMVVVVELVTYN